MWFGVASDCMSTKPSCHDGRAAIDLTGTGFTLHPEVNNCIEKWYLSENMHHLRWSQNFKSRHVLRHSKRTAVQTNVTATLYRISCHILTSHFGAAMSRWTGRAKMTCHQTSQWSSIPICIGMVLLIKYNENGTDKRKLSKYQFVVTNDTAGCLNSTTCGATIDYKLCIVTTSEFPVDVACWLDVMLRLIHRRRCGKSSGGNQVPWK